MSKNFLSSFKTLKELNNPVINRKIATLLMPELYLERDYIIFRNDIGEEMYFVVSGKV